MEYTITYPNGGSNKMWEPMHITASLKMVKGLMIKARTWTRTGCLLRLLDEHKQEMAVCTYSYNELGPGYYPQMAKDMAENMNILLELANSKARVQPKQLEPVMKDVLNKCESRYGSGIPGSDYDAIVMFE